MTLSDKNCQALEQRGFDAEIAANYGVSDSARRGFDIAFPYLVRGEVVGCKYRRIVKSDTAANFSQDVGSRQVFWNHACIEDETLAHQPLVICEGELDALSAIQAGFSRAVSVPNGAPVEGEHEGGRYQYLDDVPTDAEDIVLAVDDDEPGRRLRHAIAVKLGEARCKWVKYPTGCKDLNDVLQHYGNTGVSKVIVGARWLNFPGLYRMPELPELPEAKLHDVGIPGLENHYRARLGDFAVVLGIPSAGKSSLVTTIACHFALKHHWPVLMASLETKPQAELRQAMRSWYCGGLVRDQTPEAIAKADEWISRWFSFIVPDFEDDAGVPWVLERMKAAVVRYGVKAVIIDPWNELETMPPPPDMKETDYIGLCIKQFKRFAVKHLVHVIIVVHPKMLQRENGATPMPTLYDASGSSHWANKADVGVIVHRPDKYQTLIRVAKVRHRVIGIPGDASVKYIWERSSYEAYP